MGETIEVPKQYLEGCFVLFGVLESLIEFLEEDNPELADKNQRQILSDYKERLQGFING